MDFSTFHWLFFSPFHSHEPAMAGVFLTIPLQKNFVSEPPGLAHRTVKGTGIMRKLAPFAGFPLGLFTFYRLVFLTIPLPGISRWRSFSHHSTPKNRHVGDRQGEWNDEKNQRSLSRLFVDSISVGGSGTMRKIEALPVEC